MTIFPTDGPDITTPSEASTLTFSPNFLWGVSTSAHQVEGDNTNSQWSAWEAAGRIKSGERCGLACDWWRNAEQDLDLAHGLELNALRLSVEWSRLEPREGHWDRQAFARYRSMLAGLHQRGIRPFVSLHHFSHPLWFEQQGGFLGGGSEELFDRFVRKVVAELGDLCRDWVTFNEPNVYAALGYVLGEFPPGGKGELLRAVRVLSAMGRAHAWAYNSIHQLQPLAQVGWAHNYVVFQPASSGGKLELAAVAIVGQTVARENRSRRLCSADIRLSIPKHWK